MMELNGIPLSRRSANLMFAPDYEPDYDALWEEYIRDDELAVFYATHELVEPGAESGTSAQVGRNLSGDMHDNDQQQPVDETAKSAHD